MQRLKNFKAKEEWRKKWENNIPTDRSIITNPTQPLPGFTTLKRKHWVITNRIRTKHAKTAYLMHKWKLKGSPMCQQYDKAPETTDAIVLICPVTKLDGGYETVHNADEDLVAQEQQM
ncbi:hypothetical protein ElyMa_003143000 [Elysia marginata]|uniref:Uncharacterized protein n=1 Tax=Elysia marginata TaxID=1093978 RepID=A0AAV4ITK0_9GAST|nr:hypothetical protein ElyMa_003143000 [Elysia marginata]